MALSPLKRWRLKLIMAFRDREMSWISLVLREWWRLILLILAFSLGGAVAYFVFGWKGAAVVGLGFIIAATVIYREFRRWIEIWPDADFMFKWDAIAEDLRKDAARKQPALETYSLEDWNDDYAQTQKMQDPARYPKGLPASEFKKYFTRKYPDPKVSADRQERFLGAMKYLIVHFRELQSGRGVVMGRENMLIGPHLVLALYAVYSRCPLEEVQHDYPPAFFLELAERLAREQKESRERGRG